MAGSGGVDIGSDLVGWWSAGLPECADLVVGWCGVGGWLAGRLGGGKEHGWMA